MAPSKMTLALILGVIAGSRARAAHNDILSLGALSEGLADYKHGYRKETETFEFKDAKGVTEQCKIKIGFDPNATDEAPTVLLHGITDSGDAFDGYINRLHNDPDKPDYKHFLVIDWPRHGDSRCDAAKSPQEAARAVYLAIQQFRERHHSPAPKRIVGASMGSVLAIYLGGKDYYPDAEKVLVTPPLLKSKSERDYLVGLVTTAASREDAKKFLGMTDLRQSLPLGLVSYEALRKRMVHASPIMYNFDLADMYKALKEIPADKISIVIGNDDALIGESTLDQKLLEKYDLSGKILRVDCVHNVARDCPQLLPAY